MNIRYSRAFKCLTTISLLFFLVGFSTFFLPRTPATVTEIREVSFGGNGYSGLPHSQFFGSYSGLLFATYEYRVNSVNYSGWGLAEGYDGESVFVRYVPFSPSITFSSVVPYFLLCGFFLFLALGVRSVVVWVATILRKSAS